MSNHPSTQRHTALIAIVVLAAILMLGLYLRLISLDGTVIHKPIRADAKEYVTYAYNLREHGVYSRSYVAEGQPTADARRSPLYPLFLALVIDSELSQGSIMTVQLLQLLLGMLIILLAYRLAYRGMGRLPALLVALLVALSPHLIVVQSYLLTEILFTSLLLLFLNLTGLRGRALFFAGLVLGLTALTRPSVQYFPLFILLALWLSQRVSPASRGALLGSIDYRAAAWLLVGTALPLTLWTLRNLLAVGAPGDSQLMINFIHHGMYPNFMFQGDESTYGYPYYFDPLYREISSLSTLLTALIERFSEQPLEQLKWYLFGKLPTLYSWNIIQGVGQDVFIYEAISSPYFGEPVFVATHRLMYALHNFVVLLAAAGSLLAFLRTPRGISAEAILPIRVVALFALYFSALHMVGAPFPRYAIPMLPVIYLLALFALWRIAYLTAAMVSRLRAG